MFNTNAPSPFPPPQSPEAERPKHEDAAQRTAPVQKKQEKDEKIHPIISSSNYFTNGQFNKDVAQYQKFSNQKTGYSNLDNIQPFYPGLYCLGAISSLGKTTFAHQLSDQMAMIGRHVLYFSLEQSHFELFSKSLARCFALYKMDEEKRTNKASDYPTPSGVDIRRGNTADYSDKMAAQMDAYAKATGDRLGVVDGSFSLTVENIREHVVNYIKDTGHTPVVIVDYLQIITPSKINGRIPDTKTSIDHIVHTLKVMQTELNLSIVVISSLNRQNYMTPIDFESFKESGGIEYTADVVWGLQLNVLENEIFNREGKVKEKREMIKKAKAESPRKIDLVCLKNRYGISNYSLPFLYKPEHDLFKPDIISLPAKK